MKRAIGFAVFVALLGAAVSIGLLSQTDTQPTEECFVSQLWCDNKAVVRAEIFLRRCFAERACESEPYKGSASLRFVELDRAGGSCRSADCESFGPLQTKWDSGNYRIWPVLGTTRFDHLRVQPVALTLGAGQTYELTFVYRDATRHWPRSGLGLYCSRENRDGSGDFDGDGKTDQVRFVPSYPASEDLRWYYSAPSDLRWDVALSLGAGVVTTNRIDAECPEVIGSVDINGDGRDELFLTDGGETAAVVDLLVYIRGGLRNVRFRSEPNFLYVGGSNAGLAGIECFQGSTGGGLIEVTTDGLGVEGVTETRTRFLLQGGRLIRVGTERKRLDGFGMNDLDCFDLQWTSGQ
jgi:hypothetical protein